LILKSQKVLLISTLEKGLDMKQCVTCKQWKDEEEFNWRYKALGIRHPTCRECHKGFRKNWYEGDAHDRHNVTFSVPTATVKKQMRKEVGSEVKSSSHCTGHDL
jgi:hypothetical protein